MKILNTAQLPPTQPEGPPAFVVLAFLIFVVYLVVCLARGYA